MKQGGCTAAATRPLGRATPLPGTKVRKARVVTKGGSHATLHTSRGKWYSLFGTEQWQDRSENRKGQLGPRRLERPGRARMLSLLLEETPPQSKRENTIIWDRANTFGGREGRNLHPNLNVMKQCQHLNIVSLMIIEKKRKWIISWVGGWEGLGSQLYFPRWLH